MHLNADFLNAAVKVLSKCMMGQYKRCLHMKNTVWPVLENNTDFHNEKEQFTAYVIFLLIREWLSHFSKGENNYFYAEKKKKIK